jgi:23S rRNA (pseudouridine1915-N3)-methyltransferase
LPQFWETPSNHLTVVITAFILAHQGNIVFESDFFSQIRRDISLPERNITSPENIALFGIVDFSCYKGKTFNFVMKFRFLWIGKTKDKNWRTLQEEYLGRLSHFVKFEITEIKESAAHETKDVEGNRILGNLNQSSFVCLLDVKGLEITSHQLAEKIENWQNRSQKEVVFVICGQDGASSEVVERADYSLSLSRLTLTHEMARVVLIEQLYRAYTIIKGFPYQK